MKQTKRVISVALALSMLSASVLFTGCGKDYSDPKVAKKTLVETIGDEKIYMDRVMPAIALTEIIQEYYNNYYAQMGYSSGSIWDMEISKGTTGAESYRDSTLDNYTRLYIFYQDAMKDDKYKISDKIEKRLRQNAEELIDQMSENTLEKTGFTADDFMEYQKFAYVYDKYSTDLKESYDITKDDVKDDYDYDNEYRQYNTSYVRMALTKTSGDSTTNFTDDEKKAAKATMEKALADLKDGKNFDDVVASYKGLEANTSVESYQQKDAYPDKVPTKETDTKSTASPAPTATPAPEADAYKKATRELKNGEYSKVFEYNNYYYIVLMDDNNSTEAYDAAIEEAITTKETEKLDSYYEKLQKEDKYKTTVNKKEWNKVKLGDLTIIGDEFKKAFGGFDKEQQ